MIFFVPDEEFIENAISKLPPLPDLNLFEVYLKLDQRVGEQVIEDFQCSICLHVVWQPKQCGECEKYFCTRCIDGWLAKSNTSCPACIAKFKNAKV